MGAVRVQWLGVLPYRRAPQLEVLAGGPPAAAPSGSPLPLGLPPDELAADTPFEALLAHLHALIEASGRSLATDRPLAPPPAPPPRPELAPRPEPAPAPQRGGKWAWPVRGRVTSDFGPRKDPIHGGAGYHTGLDISAARGTPIRVPLGGKVVFAAPSGGAGNFVVVDHGGGLQTAYAHLSHIGVHAGQHVGAGDSVGKVGSTGRSTGPHLHFEVKKNGKAVDPRPYLERSP